MKAENKTEERILAWLEANASEELKAKLNSTSKTLSGCLKYCAGEARKRSSESGSTCVCVDDSDVFAWSVKYFEDDSLDHEVKAPAPKPAKKTEPKKEEPKPEVKNVEPDLFSFEKRPEDPF